MTDTPQGYRISPQQERVWQLMQEGWAGACRVRCEVRIEGELDRQRLAGALARALAAHEILRTRFRRLPGLSLPVQAITDAPPHVEEHDWRDVAPAEQEELLDSLYEELQAAELDCEGRPPTRFHLVWLAADRAALFMLASSLCADEASLPLLARAIAAQYEAPGDGEAAQYVELAQWAGEMLESDETRAGREFWDAQGWRAGLALRLPGELAPDRDAAGGPAVFACDPPRGAEAGLSPTFLLACWVTLAHRLTGASRVVVGMPFDGRTYEELAEAVGPLARAVPLAVDVHAGMRFEDLHRQVEEVVARAAAHQEYFAWASSPAPLGDRPAGRFPLGFAVSEAPPVMTAGGVHFAIRRRDGEGERFHLKLAVRQSPAGWAAEFHYDPARFDAEEVARLAERWRTVVESARRDPRAALGAMEVVGPAERHWLIEARNATGRDFASPAVVHEWVERWAAATPANTAVVCEDRQLTYEELNRRANHLAHALRARGLGREARVAIYMERAVDAMVAILGVLKAGAAYVPLDPAWPAERLAAITGDAGAAVVLTQKRLQELVSGVGAETLCLDADWQEIASHPADDPRTPRESASLAYLIYTSGSTGLPKGVAVEHRQLVNYAEAVLARLGLPPGSSFATVSTLAADLGNTAIFAALAGGGCLHILTSERATDPQAMADYMGRHAVDCLKVVPSHLEALLGSSRAAALLPRRRLVLGGEAASWDLLGRVAALAPDCAVLNHYGPTESTVGALTYAPGDERPAATVPLGGPLANLRAYVLDDALRPAPAGVIGELHLAGAGLARGYWRRPSQTAEKFMPDPFAARPGERMYRTGDLARVLPDGNVEFLGRADHQVKIRGYRVEPGEIEAALRQHPAVQSAVVLTRADERGAKHLAAFAVAARPNAEAIDGLPRYELPNGWAIVHQNRNETDYAYQEIFEQASYFRHGIRLEPGACVIDVGANIGMFTLAVKRLCPDARVFAFEPAAPICDLLRVNAELYAPDARVFAMGLAGEEGEAEFTYFPGYSVMSGLAGYADAEAEKAAIKQVLANRQRGGEARLTGVLEHADDLLASHLRQQTLACRLTTLSAVLRREGIERVDLLKIDVQRAEMEVVRGIAPEDWGKIRQIVLEVHDLPGTATEGRLAEVLALLEEKGFVCAVEQTAELQGTDRHTVYAVRDGDDRRPAAADSLAGDEAARRAKILRAADLEEHLLARLPEYMQPATLHILEALPLTPNGKVDRAALLALAEGARAAEAGRDQPGNETERRLAAIWADLLKLDRVGVHDNFFKLGGDSILGIQVIARAHQEGIQLTPRQLFEHPTIAELAAVAGTGRAPAAEQGVVTGPLPLTPIQHWFFADRPLDPHHWNMAVLLETRAALRVDALRRAAAALAAHHDALRTTFRPGEQSWLAEVVEPRVGPPVSAIDLSDLHESARVAALEAAAEQAQGGFDLAAGALLRLAVFDLGQRGGRLLIVAHHLAVDGVSWRILLEDLQAAYRQALDGRPAQLPPKTTSFRQWAERLQAFARTEAARSELDGWLALPWERVAPLPAALPPEAQTVDDTATVTVELSPEETGLLLADVHKAYNTQINDVLLAALARAVRQWTGAPVCLVDLEGHGREEIVEGVNLTRTVGCFTTRFPVLLDPGETGSPGDELKAVKETLRAIPSRGVGYGVLRYLADEAAGAALARLPQPDISFNYLGQLDTALDETSLFAAAHESAGPPRSRRAARRHQIEMNCAVSGGRLVAVWRYGVKALDRRNVAALAENFIDALRRLLDHTMSGAGAGFTASDFSEFGWDDRDLEAILGQIAELDEAAK